MPPVRRARYNPTIINICPGESFRHNNSSALLAKSNLANSIAGFFVVASLQTILAGCCAAFTVWPHWRSRGEEKPEDS